LSWDCDKEVLYTMADKLFTTKMCYQFRFLFGLQSFSSYTKNVAIDGIENLCLSGGFIANILLVVKIC